MKAKFQISNEDLIAQQENVIGHAKVYKKALAIQLLLMLVLLLFIYIIIGISVRGIVFGLVLFTLLIPIILKFFRKAIMKRFKREFIKELKNKVGDYTVTLSEEGLIHESENVTKRTSWSNLMYVTQDNERYFLYLTDLDVIIIKKNPDDLDEEEASEYQAFLRSKTAPLIIRNKTSFVDKIRAKHIANLTAIILVIIIGIFAYRWMFAPEMTETYSGESEHWEVQNLVIKTGERASLSSGSLSMKGEAEFWADYFKSTAHVVLSEGSVMRMHKREIDADNLFSYTKDEVTDVAENGFWTPGALFITKFWVPMTINNIEEVYVNVQWRGENDDDLKEEKIILIPNET